jgi:hypothetical protein
MARSFNGSSDVLDVASAPATALPVTMACWTYATVDTNGAIFYMGNPASGSGANRLLLGRSVTGGIQAFQATAFAEAAGFTINQWHHVAGVFRGDADRSAYLNGTRANDATASATPSGIAQTTIGARYNGGALGLYFSGQVAEAAAWSVALTDAEIAALASRAVLPTDIRRASLVGYWRLWGNSTETDQTGSGRTLTATGTARADHPPVPIRRRGRAGLVFVPAAAPPSPSGRRRSLLGDPLSLAGFLGG